MKIQAKEFTAKLKRMRPAIDAKPQMPILGSILITGSEMIATNLSVTIIERIESAGKFALPYNETLSICSNLSGEIEVTPEKITSGNDKFKLGTPEDFNQYPGYDNVEGVSFKCEAVVVESIIRASKCVHPEKYTVQGNVSIIGKAGEIRIQSTDMNSFYMHAFTIDVPEFEILLPVEIVRCLQITDYVVSISESKIKFESETTSIIGLLSEGKFPDAGFIFAQEREIKVKFSRGQLVHALTKVNVYNVIPFCEVCFLTDQCVFTISDPDLKRDATTAIDMECPGGFAFKINADTLQKLLSLFPDYCENINIEIKNEKSAILITADGSEINLLIMPIWKNS